jgi:L-threonylcarbamoyladenylate synthase
MKASIGQNLDRAAELLVQGELVAVPTETVYGLAGNGFNEGSLLRIFQAKNRPHFNPLILHVAAVEAISAVTSYISPTAFLLARHFMPGPLTLLLPRNERVPDLVTAGSSLVAVRVPAHPMMQQLLAKLDFPLAAPSANPFGYISPTTAQHVAEQLGDQLSYILDGGACAVGLESTIVGFGADDEVLIYRQGAVTAEDIARVTGKKATAVISAGKPDAPGMLASHYAPKAKVVVGDIHSLLQTYTAADVAVLSFQKKYNTPGRQEILSPSGDLSEAARNLFAALRRLDASSPSIILADPVPDEGLGRAINDRLRRASA